MNLRTTTFGVALVALVGTMPACSEPTIEEEDARQYAEQWAPSVEDYLHDQAVLAAGSEAVKARVEAAAEAEDREVQRDEPPFDLILADVYEEREFEPGFVGEEGLTEQGQATWEALQNVEKHFLDAEPYELETIEEALTTWEERRDQMADYEGLAATDEDRDEAVAWLVTQPVSEFELTDDNIDALTEALIEADDRGERLSSAVEAFQDKRSSIAEAEARVEHLLARGLARYAYEQRHFRTKEIFIHPRDWDYYSEPDVEDSGRRPDSEKGPYRARGVWRDAAEIAESIADEEGAALHHDKIGDTVAQVLSAEDAGAKIAELAPGQPQYAGLLDEFQRYKEIVADGGWEEVTRVDGLSQGSRHSVIPDLKKRLRVEGFFPDDVEINDLYDQNLTDAIEAYQTTHQLHVTGRPHNVFWYSVNVPARKRLAQIALNIERWRATNVRHDLGTYLFVNLPGFTVEVWQDHEKIEQFATVVGNNDKSVNPLTDEEEHSNRTPTPMAAYVDRVVFNPYWNVTKRIRAQDLLPDLKEWMEKKYALEFTNLLEEKRRKEQEQARRRLPSRLGGFGFRGRNNSDRSDSEDTQDTEDTEDGGIPLARLTSPSELSDDDSSEGSDSIQQDGPAEEELTEEERAELEEERRQEKLDAAFEEWTYTERTYNEEKERHEEERYFHLPKLRQLEQTLIGDNDNGDGDDEEALEEFRKRFTYLDWETGQVNVESTDPDDIPKWYEDNDYEVMHPGHDDWEYVRMAPGPENALGFVKIIFPNYENIYLHDTPARSLFSSTVRSFSHGCIRVQHPLRLSEILLEMDGQDVNIDHVIEEETYHPVFLDQQIPIFIEYYTVRVDEEGRANFLADIYDYDEEELERIQARLDDRLL